MDIKILRLVTGEFVIAECSAITPDSIEVQLRNPYVLGITKEGIMMGPLVPPPLSESKEITIRRAHILFLSTPGLELRNSYTGQIGGIVLPGSGPVLDLGIG